MAKTGDVPATIDALTRSGRSGTHLAERRVAVIACLAGASAWLFTHPYLGISGGGGALYGLLALNWVDPQTFGADLFLRFGSQDSFTIFSPLYGSLIRWMGLASANISLLLAVYALWLAGAWLLAHRLLRGLPAHVAFLLLCAIQAGYGGWSSLSAGENALTPRPLAEALVMLGLAALLARAYRRSAVALVLALAVHPIMALPGLGVAFLVVAERRRILLWAIPLGIAAAIALTLAHVDPFGRLLIVMDGEWLAAVKAHNGFAFTATWAPGDWASLVADLAICSTAALWTGGHRRILFASVCVIALAGVAVSAAGGDLFHNALIIQLQTWRCAWLLAVIKLPALVVLWLRLRRRPLGALAFVLLAAPILILTPAFRGPAWVWGPSLLMSLAGGALAFLILLCRQPKVAPALVRCALYVIAVLPFASFAAGLVYIWISVAFWLHHGVSLGEISAFPAFRLLVLAAAVMLSLMARHRPRIAIAAVAASLSVGALTWDSRTPWERFVLSGQTPLIASQLPERAQVLWGFEAGDTWFLLRRPAYVSITQANGLLFNRSTAIEWTRRQRAVWPVVPMRGWTRQAGSPLSCSELSRPIPRENVAAACRQGHGLYGVILARPVAGAEAFLTPVAQVSICASGSDIDSTYSNNHFYYLDCRQFTNVGAAEVGPGPKFR